MVDYAAVLGLSTFCAKIAVGLEETGVKVLAVDINEKRVNQIRDQVTRALCGDLRDREMVEEAGVLDCPLVLIGTPDHFDISVLLVHFLSQRGISNIIAQVSSEDHAAAIEQVGASRVIFPEDLAADQVIRDLTLPTFLDRIDVSSDASIIEMTCPKPFIGQSLRDLDLRRRYNVHIVGVILPPDENHSKRRTALVPDPETPIPEGAVLMVLGKTKDLRVLGRKFPRDEEG